MKLKNVNDGSNCLARGFILRSHSIVTEARNRAIPTLFNAFQNVSQVHIPLKCRLSILQTYATVGQH